MCKVAARAVDTVSMGSGINPLFLFSVGFSLLDCPGSLAFFPRLRIDHVFFSPSQVQFFARCGFTDGCDCSGFSCPSHGGEPLGVSAREWVSLLASTAADLGSRSVLEDRLDVVDRQTAPG